MRRAMLQRLAAGESTLSQLAAIRPMTLTGARKHVAVLERAGLAATRKEGRTRVARILPDGLQAVADALAWLQAAAHASRPPSPQAPYIDLDDVACGPDETWLAARTTRRRSPKGS